MIQRIRGLRRELTGVAIDKGLRGVARLAALHPQARPHKHGVSITRDVPFGPAPWQRLDVYRPARGLGIPILYMHGGGFRILSKDTHWGMALSFARQGYTVFVPDYRLAPKHPFPAGLEDCVDALLWVASHAEGYDCDPRALVVAGESAGGNFTVAVAAMHAWERPEPFARRVFEADLGLRAFLPACGLLQVTDPQHRGTSTPWIRERIGAITTAYLPSGHPPAMDPVARELADVICFLETAPPPARPLAPLFAVCGDRDPIRLDTERLTPAWQRLGGQATHVLYPRAGHAFHAFLWTENARRAWRDQLDFLRSLETA